MGTNIVVVDDDAVVLDAVAQMLDAELFSVIACRNAREAIDRIESTRVDVVLTDIKMPDMSGLDLLAYVRQRNPEIPVILMTAFADLEVAVDAIKKGAYDFIIKPYHPEYLIHAINKAREFSQFNKLRENYKAYLEDMVKQRTIELDHARSEAEKLSRDLVERLTTVAEFRDTEAGAHVARIGIFSEMIAEELGMPGEFSKTIRQASPLHDLGKLGITDYILFKLGPLSEEEFRVIRTHTTQGQRILAGSTHPVLKMAESIALNHHERWDGRGYPNGIEKEDIPLEGRIVMLVDQYDALRSERPYKPAVGHEEVVNILLNGDGRTMPEHFDPAVLNVFTKVSDRFEEVFISIQD